MTDRFSRRTFVERSALGLVGLLSGVLGAPNAGRPRTGASDDAARSAEERPNVIMIISDDQGWTDFGFMGHPHIRTPHLDRLASESLVFPNGYVPTSLCRASLATLLTGLYASQHKICNNDPPEGVDRSEMLAFMRNAPALPRLLASAGYRSLQTGKFWEGHYRNAGFTDGMTTEGRHGGPGLAIGRETMQPLYRFIDEMGSDPFFIWYAPFLPHTPHNPPARLLRTYASNKRSARVAQYWAMVEWFDETVGQLLDYVEAAGLKDNTMVLFAVDNGWLQADNELPRTQRPFGAPGGKLSPYDGGLRTPILIRWPKRVQPGFYRNLVSTIDLAPTILQSINGVDVPSEMPGVNVLAVGNGSAAVNRRKSVFGQICTHDAVNLARVDHSVTHQWVRKQDWKLIHYVGTERSPELYHLGQDPFEQTDISTRYPQKVEELLAELDTWDYEATDVIGMGTNQ
jgi:uncharacterized sulfatase